MFPKQRIVDATDRAVLLYRDLIEQHADQPGVSLSEIADRVGLSVDHLATLFRKEIGMTPVEYRTRLRLLRAREILVSSPMPVGDVAREVGFPDANYFIRLFRKTYGDSPRRYAHTHRPSVVQ